LALPWVRLDTSMPDNPKVIDLCDTGDVGMAAAFVWVCSLAYAGKHATDGLIPRGVLARLNGRAKHAKLLVEHRLWDEAPKGWQIHNWEDYNRVALDLEGFSPQARSNGGLARAANMTPEERTESARKAAQARWNGGGPAY
jgi:hypothetical protein